MGAYHAWLEEVGKLVHLTPGQVESRAGDEPGDCYDLGDSPLEYSTHFLQEAVEYFGEVEPESPEYASVESIQKMLDAIY